MAYRHYNIALSFRLAFLVIISILLGYVVSLDRYELWVILLTVIEIGSIYNLIRFLNRTNQQISYFIHAVKNNDTTLRFPNKTGNAIISDLHKNLNELNSILHQTKVRNKIKEQYFSEILFSIPTGTMVINDKGFITDANPAVHELLGLQTLTHISQIERVDKRFKNELSRIANRQKKVLSLKQNDDIIQVIVRCSVITLKNDDVRLITLQDIRGELESKEVDAWVKLIRVLSHEIMNSLAPITSIAQSLNQIWKQRSTDLSALAEDDDINSTIGGLEVISERGEALKHFVQSYRMLTKAPEPKLESIQINSFFDRLNILLSPLKENFQGRMHFKINQENFRLQMDEQMMVQVVINLVKNAIESFENQADPLVEISAFKNNEITELTVLNNGPRIPEDVLDEIFVPFFTTKENGSGIGLSYSKQVLRAHGGSLNCSSNDQNTIFKLRW